MEKLPYLCRQIVFRMFSLLALVATFVVETNKKISTSGVLPEGATAEYVCTGKKGQMTEGQQATLTLQGWQNTDIEGVRLSMRSNKASGAGALQMSIDGQEVWTISDSGFDQWCGEYTTEYTAIVHTFSSAVKSAKGDISIRIEASTNSLYIEKYEIIYQKSAARAYSIDLQTENGTYSRLTESQAGSGIILPTLPDEDGWRFVGWTEKAVEKTTTRPAVYAPGSTYYPRTDLVLWAVYSDDFEEVEMLQRTDCQSGFYAIAFPILNAAYSGEPDNSTGLLPATDILLSTTDSIWYERRFEITPEMVYYIDFAADSTATITHVSSAKSVGCKNKKLYDTPTKWQYRLLPDQTVAFFLRESSNSELVRALWVSVEENKDFYGKLLSAYERTLCTQALLYEAPDNERIIYYTSYPLHSDIRYIEAQEQPTQTIQIGIYKLQIVHGKKTINLRE